MKSHFFSIPVWWSKIPLFRVAKKRQPENSKTFPQSMNPKRWIWRLPKIGLPLNHVWWSPIDGNHPFWWSSMGDHQNNIIIGIHQFFFHYKSSILVIPHWWKSPISWKVSRHHLQRKPGHQPINQGFYLDHPRSSWHARFISQLHTENNPCFTSFTVGPRFDEIAKVLQKTSKNDNYGVWYANIRK